MSDSASNHSNSSNSSEESEQHSASDAKSGDSGKFSSIAAAIACRSRCLKNYENVIKMSVGKFCKILPGVVFGADE